MVGGEIEVVEALEEESIVYGRSRCGVFSLHGQRCPVMDVGICSVRPPQSSASSKSCEIDACRSLQGRRNSFTIEGINLFDDGAEGVICIDNGNSVRDCL